MKMSQPDDIQPLRAEANRADRRSQAGGRRSFRTIGSSPPLPPSFSWPGRPDPAAEDRRLHTGLRSCAFHQRFAHCCPAVRAVRALILKSLLVLGCAYLFDVFIIVPHALSFPGVLGLNGVCGARLYIGSGLSLRRALYTNRYKPTAIY